MEAEIDIDIDIDGNIDTGIWDQGPGIVACACACVCVSVCVFVLILHDILRLRWVDLIMVRLNNYVLVHTIHTTGRKGKESGKESLHHRIARLSSCCSLQSQLQSSSIRLILKDGC